MDRNLWSLDIEALKFLYEREASSLRSALIKGQKWEDLRDQRVRVTELAIALHKKMQSIKGNPAEISTRKDSGFADF